MKGARTPMAWVPPAAALTLVALYLQPARHTALRGDDVFTFETPGRLALGHESLWGFISDGARTSLSQGRPQPLGGAWGNLVIAAFDDHRAEYKAFLILMTVACAGLLYTLVRRLGAPRSIAVMTLVLLAGSIQFRQYHDPMLGYYGTTQAALACVLGSLLLELRYLRGGGLRYLALAVLLFGVSMTFYEVTSPMVIAHIGLALAERRGRAALAVAAPFMVVALAFVGYGFAVRTIAGGDTGGGYAVSYAPGTILRTYVLQMFPPLPASNFLFDGGDLAAQPTAAELGGALWRGAVVFAIVAWVGWRHRSTPLRPGLLTTMAVLGALIMLSPVALISLAEKYQHELSAATGYLPVIMQSFGWALIAAAAVLGLVRVAGARSAWAQGTAVLACAGALGLGAAVSGYDVVRVAATEVPRAVVSDTLHHAAARGVLDGLPEGSTVMLPEADVGSGKTGWGYINTFDAMLFDQTGRRYDGRVTPPAPVGTCPPDPPGVIVPSDCAPIEARAAWMRVGARRRQANVIVAPISGGGPLGRPARELFAYIEGEDLSPPSLAGAGTDGKPWTSRGLQWTRRAGGGDWALLQATPPAPYPVADTLLDTRRTVELTAAVPTGRLVRTLGTRRVLP